MKFKFKIIIANVEVEIESEGKSNKDVLRQVAFYSELPKVGPTGNKNLVLSHRTPKNFEYFSIIDKEAGKEFSFGTSKDSGELFCKGWKDAYVENRVDRDSEPNLVANSKAIHEAKEIIRDEEFVGLKGAITRALEPVKKIQEEAKPSVNKSAMNDVLAKYGLGK